MNRLLAGAALALFAATSTTPALHVAAPEPVPVARRPLNVIRERAPRAARTRPPVASTPHRNPAKASHDRPGVGRPARPGAVYTITAYCLTGTMANGARVHEGAAAARRWPLGTRLRVAGRVWTVADRTGPRANTDVDLAMPGRCDDARTFGRRRLEVVVLP